MSIGRAAIIGAGPGAPDLLTIRARRLIERADLVIMDALLPDDFLDRAGVDTSGKEIVNLGEGAKRPSQDDINEMLIHAARAGRHAARLKCGDPFVFGRGGEEIDYLTERGVQVEVVPGLSAALAAPAAAGIPLTFRGEGRSFAVVTARVTGGAVARDFPKADNLVVLMAAEALPQVAERLAASGWGADTPAAVIERSGQPWERRVYGTLERIAGLAARASVAPPAILVVGPAVLRRAARSTVLFTGTDPDRFRHLGDLLHWPALKAETRPEAAGRLAEAARGLAARRYRLVLFAGRETLDPFLNALAAAGLDARSLAGARIAVAGGGAAERLDERGIRADCRDGDDPLAGLPQGGRALAVEGFHAPRPLMRRLRDRMEIDHIKIFHLVPHPELGRPLPDHDAVLFVSPSAVRSFRAAYGEAAFTRPAWCLGPDTRAALGAAVRNALMIKPPLHPARMRHDAALNDFPLIKPVPPLQETLQ
jgi:uroporphyrin-III C-methyltransferase